VGILVLVTQRKCFMVKGVSFTGPDKKSSLSVTCQDILSMFQYLRLMKIFVSMIMFCIAEPEFSDPLNYRAQAQVKLDLSSGLLDFKMRNIKDFETKIISSSS
jgi:hypothetical protein